MDRRRACLTLIALPLVGVIGPARATVDPQIGVSRLGELYIVDALIVVPVAPREAWDVMTDFDDMARFVPNLEISRVTGRDGLRLRVEQKGVARWGLLSHSFTTVREIELEPIDRVRSKSIGGTLHQVNSETQFASASGGTEIRHHVSFALETWMPDFLAQPFLQSEMRNQFDALLAEMLRRRTIPRQ